MYFQQLVVLGLLSGAVISLVGVGFTFVLGVGKVVNFAHGAFVALGMYLGYWLYTTIGLSPYLALLPAVVAFGIVGWAVAELFERRARATGEIGQLIVGLALLLLINGALAVLFGEEVRVLSGVDLGNVPVVGLNIPTTQIVAALFTLIVAVGLFLFVRMSRWGRALRAVAENPGAAALYGIRVPIARRVAVTVSIVIAGLAGIIISPFTVLSPEAGTNFLITAFAVVIIGGIGNTVGAVLAGLGIGVVNSVAAGYLSTSWTTLAPLLLILLFLLIRPIKVAV